jgi:polysaccharide export outer membrane protein
MREKSLFLVFFLTLPLLFQVNAARATETPSVPSELDYIIAAGDILDVSVWKNEALTKTLTVLPDGKINFPLVGELVAGGKTVAQLKRELENRISQYVPQPVITVIVQQVNSMLIYVLGKVNDPGRFILGNNINVLQALAVAGGLNPFADRNKIKIFREEAGKTTIFDFEYDAASKGEDLTQNIHLKRGDIIIVP